MSWSLTASGHQDDPTVDETMAKEIGKVLKGFGEACTYAQFSGRGFSLDPRTLVDDVATEDEPLVAEEYSDGSDETEAVPGHEAEEQGSEDEEELEAEEPKGRKKSH